MIPLVLTSILGGWPELFLLIKTPAQTFLHCAALANARRHSVVRLRQASDRREFPPASRMMPPHASVAGAAVFELLVAVYGGYFVGGIGIMNLAMLAALGMTDIHAMNSLKSSSGSLNGAQLFTFVATRVIVWPKPSL